MKFAMDLTSDIMRSQRISARKHQRNTATVKYETVNILVPAKERYSIVFKALLCHLYDAPCRSTLTGQMYVFHLVRRTLPQGA
jgi:hypothetical protein